MTEAQYYSSRGEWFEIYGKVTNMDAGTWYTITTRVTSSDKKDAYTDICFSATKDGEIRMLLDDVEVCFKYYAARTHFTCSRVVPFTVPSNSTIQIQFKPDMDGCDGAANAGGYFK